MKRLASTLCADDLGKRIQVLDADGEVMFAGTLKTVDASLPFSERQSQKVLIAVESGQWRTTQHIAADTVVILAEVTV